MTKFKTKQRNLNYLSSLLLLIGFLTCGAFTQVHATTTSIEVIQQTTTIIGNVTGADDNMPLPGVNVIIKGTSNGVTTDFDGNYSIDNVAEGDVLVFSFMGFSSQEIPVNKQSRINIILKTDSQSLDEVVVVGYGSVKKESLTGAIEQVKAEVFEDRAVTNVALALQGQTPGLMVSRTSARPGNEGISMQIRGVTSINGGSPLIIIDGSPAQSESEFYQMNPDDIESISVLKDGAASIYGSRAANGVVLVTTKKGKGEMRVEFNASFRYNYLGLKPPFGGMEEYGQIWLDAAEQDTVPNYWNWGEETVNSFANGESGFMQTKAASWGYDGLIYMAPADRYNELYGSNSGNQESLSISGSSETARYRLSFGYADSQGALQTAYDGVKQYSVRLNTDLDLTEKLTLGTNISVQKSYQSGPSTSFGRQLVGQDPPVFPSRNESGQWYANFGSAGGSNSIAGTTDGGRDKTETTNAKLSLNLNYDFGKGFSATANGTYNQLNSRQDIYNLNVPLYNWYGESANNSLNRTTSIQAEYISSSYQTYGAFLNYEKVLGDHNLKGMIGLTAEKNEFQALWGQRNNIVDEGVYDILVATGTQENGGAGNNHTRGQDHEGLYSYLARINYDYQGKYLLELVGRRDGSSRFAEGYKFNNYGSASIGWNMHKEEFMQSLSFLNILKLRASIGSSGNQVGIGKYDYISTIGTGTDLFGDGGTLSPTSYVNGLTTTTRTWENVSMSNIGIDFALLDNRLSGTFETYARKNNGMLIPITYPEVLGASAPKTNSGDLETKGWEAVLNWKDQIGEFSYNVGFNMSNSNNTLTNLEGGSAIQAGLRSTVEGYPLNSYFVWETDGFFETQAEVDAYNAAYVGSGSEVPTGGSAIRIGDTKKVDLDGNGVINDQNANEYQGKGDVKHIGDAQAHYIYGINLGGTYKAFDFTMLFQGALKQNVIRAGVSAYPFMNPWPNQTNAYQGLTWTPENTDAEYPRMTSQKNLARWNYGDTDLFVQNNRFIRLKNIVVGYNLPPQILEKIKMDKVRFYVSGNDLFEFSSLVDGYDPEDGNVPTTSDSNTQRSVYPFQRTIAIGFNLAF